MRPEIDDDTGNMSTSGIVYTCTGPKMAPIEPDVLTFFLSNVIMQTACFVLFHESREPDQWMFLL